jgi:uroporphyrinogen decarboxylase
VQVGDDLAYRSGPMLSPVMLEKFYGEGYRRMTATAHRYGAKIIFHCCGNTRDLLEKFIDWGFDGAHAFEPPAGNDLAAARASVGDRLCLVGNIDITHTLFDANREEVEAEVTAAIDGAGRGGFILAPAHSHPAINVRNVRWMLEAAAQAG